ncbi:uncharacterized protein [Dermacentor andersoni]|uniref:uncharacterized protein isoform X2 n=1 Tax=Dermacentor andersoni TaxID=34620 RepID=UPI0024173870|nr:hornerin-like isoform X2 [Dermacentor andersoni]
MTERRRRGNGRWRSCTLLLVLAVMAADAESIVRSLTDEASQPGGIGDVSRAQHQGYETPRLQDTVAALPSGFEFAEAVTHDAVKARAASAEGRRDAGASSQTLYRTHEGGLPSPNPIGERYHASATDLYSGQDNFGGSGGFGFPDAMSYYHDGSGPKAYNTQHAYAYEKVYPERTYSTNHATSYEKHYDNDNNKGRPWGGGYESRYSSSYPIRGGDGGGYGFRHGDSYGSGKGSGGYGSGYAIGYGPKGGGHGSRYDSRPAAASPSRSRGGGGGAGPKIKRYVYKNPHDRSTTRVVQMHSGSRHPSWAASSEKRQMWKPGGMEQFVLGLMRDG